MESENTVKIGYNSSNNISFHGWIDTSIEQDEWDQMTEEQQDAALMAAFWESDVVSLWVIPPGDDPDKATRGWR
jgi:hypothetical protein